MGIKSGVKFRSNKALWVKDNGRIDVVKGKVGMRHEGGMRSWIRVCVGFWAKILNEGLHEKLEEK